MKYPGLTDFVKFKLIKGVSTKDFYNEAITQFGYKRNIKTFRKYVSSVKKR